MSRDVYREERLRMVAGQITARGVGDPRVLEAMESVPRHRFVPADELAYAYADGPLPIGFGQTISQPFIVALMSEMLALSPTDRVLEVGTGSGYQAAVLGCLAGEVHTIERIPELAERAAGLLVELGYTGVHVHLGDGSLGWPQESPYQAILVAASAPSVPAPLLEQLDEGGRLVLPVGSPGFQRLQVWKKAGGRCTHQDGLPVAFVPLRGEHGFS